MGKKKPVDDNLILQLHGDGLSVKEIAEKVGNISSLGVWKRLKRLTPVEEPESFSRLTAKQKAFALAKAEGKSSTAAASEAFDTTSRDSAKSLGYSMAKDPDVVLAFQSLMAQEGIGRRRRIQRLRAVIESPDLSIASRGLDMGFKLDGSYPKPEVNITQKVDMNFQQLINGPQGQAMFLEILVGGLKNGRALDTKVMGFIGTCQEELEELEKLQNENYEK